MNSSSLIHSLKSYVQKHKQNHYWKIAMDDESTDIISSAATTLFEMQWPTYEVENYYNM